MIQGISNAGTPQAVSFKGASSMGASRAEEPNDQKPEKMSIQTQEESSSEKSFEELKSAKGFDWMG